MRYRGDKSIKNFLVLSNYLPEKIDIWIEPFGGSFGLFRLFKDRINYSIYNDKDKNVYDKYKHLADKSYNLDWKEIIDKFDNMDVFFYFDPPYYKREHYYNEIFNEHIELSNKIKKLKSNFLLSYNNEPFIKNLYSDFKIVNLPFKDLYHKNEIIIFK